MLYIIGAIFLVSTSVSAGTLALMGVVVAQPFEFRKLSENIHELVPNKESAFKIYISESVVRIPQSENEWKEINSAKRLKTSFFVKIAAP